MLSTKVCVPAGTLAQAIAGDVPSPGAAPGAAWLNFTGMSAPSANPVTVSVIAGAAGAPPRWPAGDCAINGTAMDRMNTENTSQRAADMLCLLDEINRRVTITHAGAYVYLRQL